MQAFCGHMSKAHGAFETTDGDLGSSDIWLKFRGFPRRGLERKDQQGRPGERAMKTEGENVP